ncbi:TetR family transcriptional regulator [Nonomuraea sp. B5E05]|uniref:TetR/AcrR family transcriptional regulator n=1 Tax=Nonomuraea sp. B5E05 TaxID=3153569 RepID=UPI00326084A3
MRTRRQRVVDAALEVIAEQGLRGLTHRAVDARAGLPPGSASSCFRTRRALLEGVLERMLELDEMALVQLPADAWSSRAQATATMVGLLEHWLGPARTRTRARMQLYLDAGDGALLRAELDAAGERFVRMAADGMQAVGVPDAGRAARMLVAQLDGVLFDALARPRPEKDGDAWLRHAADTIMRGVTMAGSCSSPTRPPDA